MTPGKRFETDCDGCGGRLSVPVEHVHTNTRGIHIRCSGESGCDTTNWARLSDTTPNQEVAQ